MSLVYLYREVPPLISKTGREAFGRLRRIDCDPSRDPWGEPHFEPICETSGRGR